MEVGDLVRTKLPFNFGEQGSEYGVIVDIIAREYDQYDLAADIDVFAIVFWNEKFPAEEEYMYQLEVVSESR